MLGRVGPAWKEGKIRRGVVGVGHKPGKEGSCDVSVTFCLCYLTTEKMKSMGLVPGGERSGEGRERTQRPGLSGTKIVCRMKRDLPFQEAVRDQYGFSSVCGDRSAFTSVHSACSM